MPHNAIAHFDDLLRAARADAACQRLLFVFAAAELPHDATPAQRQRFAQGEGGALAPLMCVDKSAQELSSFDALVREAQQFEPPGQPWQLVFAAVLSGQPPADAAAADAATDAALRRMVDAIKTGALAPYLPFNRQGQPVQLG